MADAETSRPTVAVSGTAEREVQPDSFVFDVHVEVGSSSSDAAHHQLAARYAELEHAVAALAVELERGRISSWRQGRPSRPDWRASRSMHVTGRDLERAADVAGALGSVRDVTVHGPNWRVDKDNPAHHELQADAVHEARARAERYAAALNGRLGNLVELSDIGAAGYATGRWEAQALRAASGGDAGLESMDLTPRPVGLSASVNARWYLDLPN